MFYYIVLCYPYITPFSFSYTYAYKAYHYLLSADADTQVEKFIKRERPLRDYTREIVKLKEMASQVGSLPVYVPMHFFLLDCSRINQVINK